MAKRAQHEAELIQRKVLLSAVFTPSGPVSDRDLFAGRLEQLRRMLSAVSQAGQHAVLFGERGVGKTSLAGLIQEFWNDVAKDSANVFPVRYNCVPSDTYNSICASLAEMINDLYEKRQQPAPTGESWLELFAEVRDGQATPHALRRLLDLAGKTFIIVIDEFDQIDDQETVGLFSGTIKALSDNLVPATLILVGVADTVDELIADHSSIDRNIDQILMPRMSTNELTSIIQKGYQRVGMKVDDSVIDLMGRLAQGLPHYAHRFGQEAGFSAIDRESGQVDENDVQQAVTKAIALTQETIRAAYHRATTSPQKDALFRQVLLACALADVDDLGYFAAADIREPLEAITRHHYDIPQFVGHLRKFSGSEKGPVLQMVGEEWKRRYRFVNPVMRPYVVLRGIEDGFIGQDVIGRFEHRDGKKRTLETRQISLF